MSALLGDGLARPSVCAHAKGYRQPELSVDLPRQILDASTAPDAPSRPYRCGPMRSRTDLRRMVPHDLAAAVRVSAAAFDLDLADDGVRTRWERRLAYPLQT